MPDVHKLNLTPEPFSPILDTFWLLKEGDISMADDFHFERIALHLVDRSLPGPRFSEREIDLDDYEDPADRQVIEAFFSGHLEDVWQAEEGLRTRAALFETDSQVKSCYQELLADSDQFYGVSRLLAQHLHDVSKKVTTTKGLFIVLWFRRRGDERPFLGLFKMDHGPTEKVTLRLQETKALLLDLVVQHIDQALPDPGGRVQKWAILPHPTRPAFDVKVKDETSRTEPAQFFLNFLGAKATLSEKRQADVLFEAMRAYAEERYAGQDWKAALIEAANQLEKRPQITPDIVAEVMEDTPGLEGFQKGVFLKTLIGMNVGDLNISPDTLRVIKIVYELPSGIILRGPRRAMESLVELVEVDGETEFRIRSKGYKKSYV
jgi:nucleoid-associated protein YejK